jgi:dTDP-4-amino-4,6-dideoxygalactose transaminase
MFDSLPENDGFWNRRHFLKAASALAAGTTLTQVARAGANPDALAVNGGAPAVTVPLKKQLPVLKWPQYAEAEKAAVKAALDCDCGNVYHYLYDLEDKWRAYVQAPFVKSHMNGTSAITAMFFALDLPPGSEIMVPSYTFFGAIVPMRLFGYVPVFVDVNPRTATFDVEHAKRVLTPRVKAVMPMHSWGLPCEMDHIGAFAKEHGLTVLEDCAHAHGASMQGKKMGTIGRMGIYSYQGTKPLPGLEGGMGIYQRREDFERAAAFGHYEVCGNYPAASHYARNSISKNSPYHKYEGTGLCMKLRMHPLAAVLIIKQMETLDARNAMINRQVRQLNDRICQLPGLSEPVCRSDQQRVYYSTNMLFIDEAKAGMTRAALIKALQAEGVSASSGSYPENHKYTIYREPQWWHHAPNVPKVLAGCEEVNARAINVALFRQEAPELVEQYIKAFEKVWAHRNKLARA